MKVARKLLVSGGITLAAAGGALVLPLARPASAMQPPSLETITRPLDNVLLKEDANASFNVKTEVDPADHMLWATVTNTSDKALVPHVEFDGKSPAYEIELPLEPGESRKVSHAFTGNYLSVEVKVSADNAETLTSYAVVNIHEPVTFKATETNENVLIGTLRNNSTLVPQTVYTKANAEVKIEHLEPGESRTIAIPHTSSQNQEMAWATIATSTGYESTYTMELGLKPRLSSVQ